MPGLQPDASAQPRSGLQRAIQSQDFLITAEVMPPKGGNPQRMLAMAEQLRHRVHAVNVTDGSRAVLRMSSLAAAATLQQASVEAICQVACRDRNRIALQADLMGAHVLGIRNLLALTGDPVKSGDHPRAKSVFDLESVRLLRIITQLNQAVDNNVKTQTAGPLNLLVGAALYPHIARWCVLERRFERKLEAGAEFFQSQMVTDFERLSAFMDKVASKYNKPVLAGIFLLKSAKNAAFINRCVPGAQIPQSTIDRLERAADPLAEGIQIAAEQVQLARQICQGVHMMAVRREDLIPHILDRAGVTALKDTNYYPDNYQNRSVSLLQ